MSSFAPLMRKPESSAAVGPKPPVPQRRPRAAFPTLRDTLPAAPVDVPVRARDRLVTNSEAVATASEIRLGPRAEGLEPPDLRRILAHEAAHVAQHTMGTRAGSAVDLEVEAHALAVDVLAGRPIHPLYRAVAGTALPNTPRDAMIVEQAKRRLPRLRAFVAEWQARQARRTADASLRDPMLKAREQMDETAADPGPPGARVALERQNLAHLNRKPVAVNVTDDAVTFNVRFQVRFEDPTMEGRFGAVKSAIDRGIAIVWNHNIGRVMRGKSFSIVSDVTLVSATAPRDDGAWLITVRPNDDSPATYPGCKMDQPGPGVVAAVTDPGCAGGVMSLPPKLADNAAVVGHEMLHLFGLVDRYMMMTSTPDKGKGKPVTMTSPTRDTQGRRDPLGSQAGPILDEDLAFLFDRLGVYAQEESRGLDVLRTMEKQGMGINGVIGEIMRLEEIIKVGHDPRSLMQPRTNFNDKLVRDIEENL